MVGIAIENMKRASKLIVGLLRSASKYPKTGCLADDDAPFKVKSLSSYSYELTWTKQSTRNPVVVCMYTVCLKDRHIQQIAHSLLLSCLGNLELSLQTGLSIIFIQHLQQFFFT
jgi:hypothetical protein